LAGDTLYISGKGDQLPDGSHPATFEEQVRQCMRNVEATLKEAGLDLRHIVMSRVFLDEPTNRAAVLRIYNDFFEDGSEPASELTLVDWIPGGSHIEITCIATTDLERRKVVRLTQQGPGFHAVWAGDTLYLSGMIGVRDTRLPDALDQQVHHIGQNQADILAQAGLSLEDIVSGHVYLAHMDDYQGMNAIYKEYFSKGPGVRTTLMPTTKPWSSRPNINPRVEASFIAAKTRPAKP
jgi:2-iminobutanoate/2-iminopropanoate deaminase